jgi:hypothetical protein
VFLIFLPLLPLLLPLTLIPYFLLLLVIEKIWGKRAVPVVEKTKLTRSAGQAMAERENIKKYLDICRHFHVDTFNLEDLYSEKDRAAVSLILAIPIPFPSLHVPLPAPLSLTCVSSR